jgi:hypothetical protein
MPIQNGPAIHGHQIAWTQGYVMRYLCITSSEIEGYFL